MKDHRLIINRKNSGFGFTSVESETQNQQLKCKIDVCLADSEDSPCSSGCFGTGWNNLTFNVIASNFFQFLLNGVIGVSALFHAAEGVENEADNALRSVIMLYQMTFSKLKIVV